ncbi:MAG TPA: putative glycoside hydrolase [Bryobacteraceae bacterium]|nr:putative glycoside hydrolase [Bryobacteraceae bacterium]
MLIVSPRSYNAIAAALIAFLLPMAGCGQPTAPAHKTAPVRRTASPVPVVKPAPPVPQAPERLATPPEIIRGVYLTTWSMGLKRRIDYVIDLSKRTGVNAVVIDIKDYSGYVAYRTGVPEAQKYGAVRATVRDIDSVINRLHGANIYVIARITVFQDPILARVRPELAVHRASLVKAESGLSEKTIWLDHKGLAWIDPASRPAWDYNIAIARDTLKHGFDEVNFDYIRFPSDGNMRDMHYPVWNGKTPKAAVIRDFFAYLRAKMSDTPISADLFGLATVNSDDLGIGQVIESAYANFDYVCPMVYPSHYAKGFRGFPKPAEHPYEVVKYSMEKAVARLRALQRPAPTAGGAAQAPTPRLAKLRPWLQDFDVGAIYDAGRVRAQIGATEAALGSDYAGYLMWAPSNVYTEAALEEPKTESEVGQ